MSTVDGRTLQNTELGSLLNTAAPTPEPFGSMADDGFYSKMIMTLYKMKNRYMNDNIIIIITITKFSILIGYQLS